jgi:AcrR family transcriptional regulator
MGDVASIAGVAKATLYNHFRTKEDVLAALVSSGLDTLVSECEGLAHTAGLTAALQHAARTLAAQPALRRVALDEPGLLRPLLVTAEGDNRADAAVSRVLAAAGVTPEPYAVETVRRWLSSYVWDPGVEDRVGPAAALLAGTSATPEPTRRGSRPPPRSGGTRRWPGRWWEAARPPHCSGARRRRAYPRGSVRGPDRHRPLVTPNDVYRPAGRWTPST